MQRDSHTSDTSGDRGAKGWDGVKTNWKDFKGKVKERWGKLTDDDLGQVEGRRDQLVAKVQKAYGLEPEQAEAEVDAFMKENRAYLHRTRDPNMPH